MSMQFASRISNFMAGLSLMALAQCGDAVPQGVAVQPSPPLSSPRSQIVAVLGSSQRLIVTPPPDREMDPRLAGAFSASIAGSKVPLTAELTNQEPINVSGYHITIETLSPSSCALSFITASSPLTLDPGKSLTLTQTSDALSLNTTIFPDASSDVDIYLRHDGSLLAYSTAGTGAMDAVSYSNTSCSQIGGGDLTFEYRNYLSSSSSSFRGSLATYYAR